MYIVTVKSVYRSFFFPDVLSVTFRHSCKGSRASSSLSRTSPSVEEHEINEGLFVQHMFRICALTLTLRHHIIWSWLLPATFLVLPAPSVLPELSQVPPHWLGRL